MRRLLWLYPRDWRRRYGAEMEALLRQIRPGPRQALDLLRGAVDAHAHPQWRRRPQPLWRRLAAAIAVIAAAVASHAVAVPLGAADATAVRPVPGSVLQLFPTGQAEAAGLLAAGWLLAALAWRWLGAGFLSGLCALLAVRFTADWLLLPAALAAAGDARRALVFGIAASTVQVAVWGTFAVVVLRRTGLAWPAAFVAGGLLELLLGSTGLSPVGMLEQALLPAARWQPERWDWTFLPGYVEPLRIALWAALLAALARRPRRRPWTEPPEGAPVWARPAPDPPQPLEARARRAS